MPGPTITVSNATELRRTVYSMASGGTILLNPGDYGEFRISGWRPTGTITIKSANPDNDAVFRSITISNASNITVADIDISRPLRGESGSSPAVALYGDSNISLVGIDLAGSLDGNSWNDGRGITVVGGDHISILDSTFRQFGVATIFSRVDNIIFAGNRITEVNEGVQFGQVNHGLVERNYTTNMTPNYAAGEHPDAYQIYSSRVGASSDIAFRNNVIIEGTSGPVGGFFIRSERAGEGILHSNLSFDNNYYQGTYRHAISVNDTNGVVIDNNTVLNSAKPGLDAAITISNVNNARITDNIAPLYLQAGSTNVALSRNIDVWDSRSRAGVAVADLFAPTTPGAIDFAKLAPLSGSLAANTGAGFRAVAGIGDLTGSLDTQLATYLPQFGHAFATNFLA